MSERTPNSTPSTKNVKQRLEEAPRQPPDARGKAPRVKPAPKEEKRRAEEGVSPIAQPPHRHVVSEQMSELFDDFFFESIGGQHIVIKDDPVPQRPPMQAEPPPEPRQRPSHYKVISISLYTQDLEQLDALVKAAKARGLTRMSRSQLIREALRQVDLAQIPPQR